MKLDMGVNLDCTGDPCKGGCGCASCKRAYYDAIEWD